MVFSGCWRGCQACNHYRVMVRQRKRFSNYFPIIFCRKIRQDQAAMLESSRHIVFNRPPLPPRTIFSPP